MLLWKIEQLTHSGVYTFPSSVKCGYIFYSSEKFEINPNIASNKLKRKREQIQLFWME